VPGVAPRRGLPQGSRNLMQSARPCVLGAAWAGSEQLIELVEQGAQGVPGRDDLAVRVRDYRLPPAVFSSDNDRWMVLAEPAQTKHLVIFVRYRSLRVARSCISCLPALAASCQR